MGRPKGMRNKKPSHKYTYFEIAWLRENYPKYPMSELQPKFNEKFNCNVGKKALLSACKRNNIYSGRPGYFEKGHIPMNKGKSWDEYMSKESQQGCRKTTFKKGNIPKNHKPVGTIIMKSDGYIYEKIAETNVWKLKHHMVWEEAHGPIPKDHIIVFLDGNHENLDINNLKLTTRRKHATMCKHKLYSEDSELTESGFLLVDVKQKIVERRRDNAK